MLLSIYRNPFNFYLLVFVFCIFAIEERSTFSLNIPFISGPLENFRNFNNNNKNGGDNIDEHQQQQQQQQQQHQHQMIKKYSGKRVRNDSIRMVYFYDQTVAVVELQADKLLLGCELIEVYEPEDALKILNDFQQFSRPIGITFNEMTTLMKQCQQVEDAKANNSNRNNNRKNQTHPISGRGILANNPFVLLSGIIPGTKWCGTGDIAKDYYDLGTESGVDKCCRAHDLCPIKVRAFSQRYNLTNDSLYTKSHCTCDDELYNCLKTNNSPTANVMGTIYFNFIQIPCVEDVPAQNGKRRFRQPKNTF